MRISAHRGSSGVCPENTLAAVSAAIAEGVDGVEVDVQLTLDGRLVVVHDWSLARTAGHIRSISTMTWRQIREYDVGGWFGNGFAGERIPALEEVLELVRGRAELNIELKSRSQRGYRRLGTQVKNTLARYGRGDGCIVTARNRSIVETLRRESTGLRTGLIIRHTLWRLPRTDLLSVRERKVTPELVDRAHRRGIEVHAWTVNARADLERMLRYGVDNIITDHPARAREWLEGVSTFRKQQPVSETAPEQQPGKLSGFVT